VLLIQASSVENPYFNRERYYERQKTMDPRRFNMMYGGEWNKVDGMVYDCFDEEENICEPFAVPSGSRIVAGVDWGHNHPFVIKVRAVTPSGQHLDIGEYYKSGLRPSEIIEIARQKKQIFGIERFYCDPSRPEMIAEFNANKLPAEGANNDILMGVGRHYELIKTRKYKMFRGACPHTLDEIETYHYPSQDEIGPNQADKDHPPVDQNNHAMDADRYVTMATFKGAVKRHTPMVPGEDKKHEDTWDRLQRLKKAKSSRLNTEEWS